ncbi:MAG: GntR family transcriptional regulator [Rhodospirillales bacterium]|nr:GntR family transcriptional regulator [Rhodospirillales bacterium]
MSMLRQTLSSPIGQPEPIGIAAQLCQALEDDIVSGQLAPGTRLEEPLLAKRFGVSRTPVREALQLLTATELAEKIPNRGVYVSLATPERLTAMFESMAELEGTCGRLAAKRMTSGERHTLEKLHHELAETVRLGDSDGYEALNRSFHNTLYRGTHNDVLVDVTFSVRRRVAPFRRVQFSSLPRLAASHGEHQGIVDAILRGDFKAAEELLYGHIMAVHDISQEYLASLREGDNKTPSEDLASDGVSNDIAVGE